MNVPDLLLVAGLGRCGTSLMMRMLSTGGVSCAGQMPDFEIDRMAPGAPSPAAWLAQQERSAVKWLDPHRVPLPADLPRAVIWLDRDVAEQAKSQIKLLDQMMGISTARNQRRRWVQSLRTDRRRALAMLGDGPRLMLTFEDILQRPTATACRVRDFVRGLGWGAPDGEAMAACVLPRSPRCLPGMDIEWGLTIEHG